MTRIADTSFLITLFDAKDARQRTAEGWASDAEPIEVPVEVLVETMGVVEARKGYEKARSLWQDLRRIPNVHFMDATSPEEIGEAYRTRRRPLTWVDVAVVFWARRKNAKVLAFDPDIDDELKD